MAKSIWSAVAACLVLGCGAPGGAVAGDRVVAYAPAYAPAVERRFQIFIQGGARSSPADESTFSGIDSFFGPDDLIVDHRSLSFDSTGFAGAGFRIYAPSGPLLGLSILPIVQPFAGASFIKFFDEDQRAAFADVSTFGATGTAVFSQSFAVPLVVGTSLPLTSIGINLPGVSLEYFSGVDISEHEFRFDLTEGAAPGGVSTFASASETTVRPLMGVGVQVRAGTLAGIGGITLGANATAVFPNDFVVSARSTNFTFQSYRLKRHDDETEFRGTFTLGIDFDILAR